MEILGFLSEIHLPMGQDLCLEKFVEASTPKFGEILRNEQMSQLVDKKQVETLKVPELKDFLRSVGCPVSNKIKSKLVQDVYDHFKFH